MNKRQLEVQMLRDAQVTKSNAMIQRTRYNLDVAEQRLLLFLIAHIGMNDTELPVIQFTIADFFRVVGIKYASGSYTYCKEVIQSMADKSFWIEEEPGCSHLCRWISEATVTTQGNITVKLHDVLKPFLLQLRKDFTRYELAYTLQFKSKYSTRLYEYVKSIKYDNLRKMFFFKLSVDNLRDRLGVFHRDNKGNIIKNDYPRYPDFKRFAIVPAIREINEWTDMIVEFEEVKQGRKVTEIILKISTKDSEERVRIRQEIDRALTLAAGGNPDQLVIE